MCGRAKSVTFELNQRNDILEEKMSKMEEKLLKLEQKLSEKKKKIKLMKKQKEAQQKLLCTIIICLIAIIVMICVSREMTSNRIRYLS